MSRGPRFRPPARLLLVALFAVSCGVAGDHASTGGEVGTIPGRESMATRDRYQEARDAYGEAEFESARALFDSVAAVEGSADTRARAQSLMWSCLSSWRLVELTTGRQTCEAALDLELREGLDDLTSQTRNGLGLVAWEGSRLVDAMDHFQRALADATARDDSLGVLRATGNLGLIQVEFGDFDAARRSFETMRDGGHALGNRNYEANALTNLGMLAVRTGAAKDAVDVLTEARRIYQANDEIFRETNAIGQLATAWAALGDYTRAKEYADTAIARARELDLRQESSSNIEVLASITGMAGDLNGALQLYETAHAFNESSGRPLEQAADLRAESELHLALGDTALARSKAQEALIIDRRIGASLATMYDLDLLAEIESRARAETAADAYLAEARVVGESLDAPLSRVELAIAEARIYERRGNASDAIRVLDAVDRGLDVVGVDPAWQADLIRSRALARLQRLPEAALAGQRAVRTLEAIRARIGTAALRTAFLSEQADAYWHLADVLRRLGRTSEAFEVADGAHGRAILDHLVATGSAAAASPERGRFLLVDRMDRLRESISDQYSLPREEQDTATLRVLYDSLAAAHRAWDADATPAVVPVHSARLLGGLPTRYEDVRVALGSDEALLEFFVGRDHTIIFCVRPSGLSAVVSDLGLEAAAARTRAVRDLMSTPGNAEPTAALERLWNELVEPVERAGTLDGVDRLIIVRHGPFASFPFAALRAGPGQPWLAEQFELQVIPTAAALVELRRPVSTPAATGPSTVFAPSPSELPASRLEARAITRVRPEVQARMGRVATEAAVRDALSRGARILHVAAHATFDRYNPLLSYIALAAGRNDAADDGRLEIREVIGLKGDVSLVFLSGCETGAGNAFTTAFTRSDDYATIAQAFLYAGAHNVIATLWRVADDGAEAFASRFYQNLANEPVSQALARTQREMIADSRYSSPFYWAGYQLAGNGGPVTGLIVSRR